ncbi:hypothetical protein DXG03_000908 [Asterophora parasitica]|uniref:Uncharacterized protein n=1 Tax=Asterophora parasitica TaxID=117018 RepID=A0A9P7G436_9AGAR|nr:hypothetical protein DXG03_000908 [Asterophora parasitica]
MESTYLQPPPDSILSTTDLIACHAIALQKQASNLAHLHTDVFAAHRQATLQFKCIHARTVRDFDFQPGSLVLMCNTKVEKSLNRKMRPQYLGPLVIVSQNHSSAYIVCELNGSILHQPVATFRLLPYLTRESIPFDISSLDINTEHLWELEHTDLQDDEDLPNIGDLESDLDGDDKDSAD